MKWGKIRLLFNCLMCHTATGKEGLFLFFFEKLKIFQKKIKTNLPLLVAAWYIKKRDFNPFHA
jgi:hypothetical protein